MIRSGFRDWCVLCRNSTIRSFVVGIGRSTGSSELLRSGSFEIYLSVLFGSFGSFKSVLILQGIIDQTMASRVRTFRGIEQRSSACRFHREESKKCRN